MHAILAIGTHGSPVEEDGLASVDNEMALGTRAKGAGPDPVGAEKAGPGPPRPEVTAPAQAELEPAGTGHLHE